MKQQPLLILGGTYVQAARYADENKLLRRGWFYVSSWEQVMGISRETKYVVVGTFFERKDAGNIMHILESRNIQKKG